MYAPDPFEPRRIDDGEQRVAVAQHAPSDNDNGIAAMAMRWSQTMRASAPPRREEETSESVTVVVRRARARASPSGRGADRPPATTRHSAKLAPAELLVKAAPPVPTTMCTGAGGRSNVCVVVVVVVGAVVESVATVGVECITHSPRAQLQSRCTCAPPPPR